MDGRLIGTYGWKEGWMDGRPAAEGRTPARLTRFRALDTILPP